MSRFSRRRQAQPARLLHHLEALLTLTGSRQGSHPASRSGQAWDRRRQQRLALAQRLLDPLPEALQAPGQEALLFWRVLRWGGAGMLLAWLLQRLATAGS